MKKIILMLIVLLLASVIVFAKLSDDTLGEVEDLRFKHYGYRNGELGSIEGVWLTSSDITWTRDFLSIKVEGNKLIIETQDGKWFIEMEINE